VKARDGIERSGLVCPSLDLGSTVVELISYDGAAVDSAPQTEQLVLRTTQMVHLIQIRPKRPVGSGSVGDESFCLLLSNSIGLWLKGLWSSKTDTT
jgi:hypothetical protein